MPMGLTYTPATFICTVNSLLKDMLDSSMVVFLDKILMYFCIAMECFTILEKKY